MKNSIIDVRIGGKSLNISQDRQLECLEDFAIVFIKTIEAAAGYSINKISFEIDLETLKKLGNEAKYISYVEVS